MNQDMLEKRFYQGLAREILEETIDSLGFVCTESEAPWVIASLAWLGRLEEAQWQLSRWESSLSDGDLVMCRFFTAIALARFGQSQQAIASLIENVRTMRRNKDPRIAFFAYQGLAFFRFQTSRYSRASGHATKALKFATLENFIFGRIFASDLRGHSLVFTGSISSGLRDLKAAQDLARKLGNQAVQNSVESSLFFYQAKFGLSPNVVKQIYQKIDLAEGDSYSKTMLLIELARQLTLQGRISKSLNVLSQATQEVFARNNHKQAAKIKLRMAHNYLIQGNGELAIKYIEGAAVDQDGSQDPVFESERLGLKLKVLNFQGILKQTEAIKAQLYKLQKITGVAVSDRILKRQSSELKLQHSDDHIADLLDQVSVNPSQIGVMQQIIDRNLFLSLYQVLGVRYGSDNLCLNILPGQHTFITQGDIIFSKEPLSKKLVSFFKLCADEKIDKSTIIESIWGYRYDPMRHDHLVYNLVAKARRFLGQLAHWIRSDEDGYQLDPKVTLQINALNFHHDQEPKREWLDQADNSLNIRQLMALESLKLATHLTVRDYMELTKTTKVTATRDLRDLVDKAKLKRMGRGRATAYIRT
ncbi:hypothetical protein [Pseudobacteriovorax antillogorgiicola]|uniref:HTH deoR-type domain-containing protein n=1 Tax=Pseudobacteriovorax antillogorgiicola TaxID=1513793 RepID=A0A1Y6CU90_9BACT|nr:hypothetical protein [Pseudobacteriovorax antillogorgiicola]TCS44783.1 hypothetical protein EDD56_13112 [Pseudobacteriovorax antillogorgiicola]SMF77487.1 hypothetical protein SAMN06296036_13152 [Pseudobacteriovorax antillogorgiicola]